MTLTGHVIGGQIVPDAPTMLPEGAAVRIEVIVAPIRAPAGAADLSGAPLREQLREFLRHQTEDLPPDAAENHDHYLYGTPKR